MWIIQDGKSSVRSDAYFPEWKPAAFRDKYSRFSTTALKIQTEIYIRQDENFPFLQACFRKSSAVRMEIGGKLDSMAKNNRATAGFFEVPVCVLLGFM